MRYEETAVLKNGETCLLRQAGARDAREMLHLFLLTHAQSDYLLTYPDENDTDVGWEERFLSEKEKSPDEIELCALIGGQIVGSAGIEAVGRKEKIRHRADFGISVEKAYQGLGVGRALTRACVECARRAGYAQLELTVVADNRPAVRLYESVGFTEYGRNPRGFRSRKTGWQEIILMRLALN